MFRRTAEKFSFGRLRRRWRRNLKRWKTILLTVHSSCSQGESDLPDLNSATMHFWTHRAWKTAFLSIRLQAANR